MTRDVIAPNAAIPIAPARRWSPSNLFEDRNDA